MYHLAKGLYLYATSKEGQFPHPLQIAQPGVDSLQNTPSSSSASTMPVKQPSTNKSSLSSCPPTRPETEDRAYGRTECLTITLPDMYLKIWDVGGQHSLRKLWQSYYTSCHAIVFVIDSTDIGDGNLEHDNSGRLEECRLVLEDVLQHSETEGVPLLVLANKQDREDCVEVVRIKEGLVKKVFEGSKGASIRDSRVLPVSALTGTGSRRRWSGCGVE